MKVAFVTMRYGTGVIGGAEAFCEIIAEHMSGFWDVDVLTTTATDHFTWEKKFEAGKSRNNSVNVIRFDIDELKNLAHLGQLGHKLMAGKFTKEDELDWINTQGPLSKSMFDYIKKNINKYDAFFFWGYLFAHTYYGLQLAKGKSVLIPFIHDEPFFYFDVYNKIFSQADAIVFETPEEKKLLQKHRPYITKNSAIIGTKVDVPDDFADVEVPKKYRVKSPYLIYVGRIEPAKGVIDLINMFLEFKKDDKSDLKLVLVGNRNNELPESDDIIQLGPVFGSLKFKLISDAKILINPSPFESFSLVICEAWLTGVPVLVNGGCLVLQGQVNRSNSGLWYQSFHEFKVMINFLMKNSTLRHKMAENGKNYVKKNYSWPIIEKKYLSIVNVIAKQSRTLSV